MRGHVPAPGNSSLASPIKICEHPWDMSLLPSTTTPLPSHPTPNRRIDPAVPARLRRRSLSAPLNAGVQCLVTIALLALGTVPSRSATTLAYSFETLVPPNGPDGFFGLGATVSQEPTIGVTHLENSLKYEIGVGGFVGARTESIIPVALNDPPGVDYVLLDLTITQTYPDTFANLGITVFGHALNAPGGPVFGHQVQFNGTIDMAGLARRNPSRPAH